MSHLFSPLEIRGLSLKNRVVVSPMQQYSSEDGFAADWHLVHLGSRAVGGAGLILTECAAVNEIGRGTYNDLGIWKDAHMEKWEQINAFVHDQGAKIGIQLGHFGGKGSRSHPKQGMKFLGKANGGWETVSASAVPPFPGKPIPRALEIAEIAQVIEDFAQAARRSVQAGFDAIELHFAHGYLVHQFLSRIINQRQDEYGGSFKNRTRLAVEIVEAIRQVIPDSMPLMVKISAVDYLDQEDAWTLTDSVELGKLLQASGVDVITASGGGFARVDKSILRQGYQVDFAKAIKEQTGLLTGAVGLITEADYATQIVEQGACDLVVIAREHLRNPYFTLAAAEALGAEIGIPWQYKRGFD